MSRETQKAAFPRLWIASIILLSPGGGLARGAAARAESPERTGARAILRATGVQGGLVVHLGCGDGKLTAALRANDGYLVHGLDGDAANVERARKHIRSLGLYGKVSVEPWQGGRLPYIDNLVSLVVSDDAASVPAEEVLRVLAPEGVAYVKKGGRWTKTIKPRPKEIDIWTHYLHDASGNAVGHDSLVGPPRRLQWVGSPRWARHHDHMASMSALVSTGGRIFYIFDEGSTASIQLPPKWTLIARDAFNGTILWKRPIASWHPHLWPLKSGHAQLPRRLVAVGDTVYVTLGLDAPLTALDAATGKTIRTYQGSKPTEEVIASEGVLFLLIHEAPATRKPYKQIYSYCWDETARANRGWAWDEQERLILAVEADTGAVLWKKRRPAAPLTLAADRKGVFFHDGKKVVCLDRKSGQEIWSSEPVGRRSLIPTSFGPTLVVYQDVVLFAGGDRSMTGLSAKTGKTLWTAKHHRGGHQSPEDLLVVDGMAWSGAIAGGGDSGVFTGRDVRTGEVTSEFPPDVQIYWFHHRCHRSKATDRYLLPSRTGIEFVDFRKKHWTTHHWVRGGCVYGIMPCNGLVYAPPHSCACYLESKLYGFNALAPAFAKASAGKPAAEAGRLERGRAYARMGNPPFDRLRAGNPQSDDWPTYRHDPARSGCTKTSVHADLKRTWQADLGRKLSSVVIAEGKVFVASVDSHTVHALDASSGRTLWSYTAGGRVDSPPTIYQGRVLFGSADGWVYCLRASDAALAWRFRAAPEDRRLTAFEQVESVWPVPGSVLVQGGVVYCVAGRSMYLDGGLRLCRLDAKTGRKLSETLLDDREPESGRNMQVRVKGLTMPVALPDVLSSDGGSVYMRSQRFDLEGKRRELGPLVVTEQATDGVHLFSPIGFLDGSWFHRSYSMYGRSVASGWGGWFRAGRFVPAGRILVLDESSVYGYGRKPQYLCQSSVLEYQLFAADRKIEAGPIDRVVKAARRINARPGASAEKKKSGQKKARRRGKNLAAADWRAREKFPVADLSAAGFKWRKEGLPLHVRAMVLAGKTLFIAGPPDVVDEKQAFSRPDDAAVQTKLREQAAALEGRKGALLWAVSAADGKKLGEYRLESPPVWDGMAAANGRLYLSTMDGRVLCYAGR